MGRRAMVTPAAAMPLLFVVVTLIALGAAMVGVNRPQPAVAGDVAPGSSAGPTQAVAGATFVPGATLFGPSSPPIVIDPAQLRELQRGARRAMRSLATAARTGDLAAARALLGESAPDLRASGLRNASIPDVAATDIAIVRSGDEWIATAGADRLTSRDGASWTFDYADRPLAVFTGSSERDLYWLAPGGRRDLFLRVASVAVSRSGLSVRFAWRYGPGGAPGDAPYFGGASIAIWSVTLGTRTMPLAGAPGTTIRAGDLAATTQVLGAVDVPATMLIQVAVRPAGTGAGGGAALAVSTVFELKAT